MTTLYLDTEFNGFGGELISMALVSPEGDEWYEVLDIQGLYTPWVDQHVVPILKKKPISKRQFQTSLETFLLSFKDTITIIADWPEDFKHLTGVMIERPGFMINTPRVINFQMDRNLPDTATHSKCPHNALWDARALATVANNPL